ncbi:right-handed parallel beta-helix repeat-containing protein [[Phormidium] sp. ETS-05]|uniref:right-handed parallel beta-helix repeat-containing protein n=1 Tax=[Phormidium] sp. ETS-05 TaxID=222819 RepID=UPI0018EEE922|nr:DUF1565 domain-containing protein [[Phormidium] sp. ETS-05]
MTSDKRTCGQWTVDNRKTMRLSGNRVAGLGAILAILAILIHGVRDDIDNHGFRYSERVIAATPTEIEAMARRVSVLISPNLTQKGDKLVVAGQKTGSGVLVARSGNTYYVLTALHVVSKTGGFHAISTADGAVYYVDATANSPDIIPLGKLAGTLGEKITGLDLALLKFTSQTPYEVARIAPLESATNEPVFISGWPNPDDLRLTVRQRRFAPGNLAEIVTPPIADGGYSLLYTSETSDGMSGGPIFNANGELIGIHGRGRGIENNCSTPEISANHSCGIPISLFLNSAQIQAAQIPFNAAPVTIVTTPSPVPTASPEPATTETVYYIDPQRGANKASAGKTPDNPFQSITYALQGAQPGTIINLAPGLYSSKEQFPIKIPTGVIIQGDESNQGQAIIISGGGWEMTRNAGRQNLAIVAGDRAEIKGVTITNPQGTGIWIENSNPIIRNNSFTKSQREGILITGMAAPVIENNKFHDNQANGIAIIGQSAGNIHQNQFYNNGFALVMGGASNPTIAANHLLGNRIGIIIIDSSQPVLQDNIIENNSQYGILIQPQAELPDIQNNLFRANKISNTLIAETNPTNLTLPASLPRFPFSCIQYDRGWATFAQNGSNSIPQPLLIWNESQLLPPQTRCQDVTTKLNGIITVNGNRLEDMLLTTGELNNSNAICFVRDIQEKCEPENLILNVMGNHGEALKNIFIVQPPANSIQKIGGETIAPLQPLAQILQPEPGLWFVK